jgi:hypothetical protein
MAKVLVSMDDALLRRIDRAAASLRLSRSAYLAELARRDTARTLGQGELATVRAALRRLDDLFAASPSGDSTTMLRAERDAR